MPGVFDSNSQQRRDAMNMERTAFLQGKSFDQSDYLNGQQRIKDANGVPAAPLLDKDGRPIKAPPGAPTTLRGAFLSAPLAPAVTGAVSGGNKNWNDAQDGDGGGSGGGRRRGGRGAYADAPDSAPAIDARLPDAAGKSGIHRDIDGNIIGGTGADGAPLAPSPPKSTTPMLASMSGPGWNGAPARTIADVHGAEDPDYRQGGMTSPPGGGAPAFNPDLAESRYQQRQGAGRLARDPASGMPTFPGSRGAFADQVRKDVAALPTRSSGGDRRKRTAFAAY